MTPAPSRPKLLSFLYGVNLLLVAAGLATAAYFFLPRPTAPKVQPLLTFESRQAFSLEILCGGIHPNRQDSITIDQNGKVTLEHHLGGPSYEKLTLQLTPEQIHTLARTIEIYGLASMFEEYCTTGFDGESAIFRLQQGTREKRFCFDEYPHLAIVCFMGDLKDLLEAAGFQDALTFYHLWR